MINFEFKCENLIFQEIHNTYEPEKICFGLFKEDGTKLGESICPDNKYPGEAWYLSDIYIFTKFERKGYGTQLLEMTCEALLQRQELDIVLERPGNTIASDGFDRKAWYERHGFKSCPPPSTIMFRQSPNHKFIPPLRCLKVLWDKCLCVFL